MKQPTEVEDEEMAPSSTKNGSAKRKKRFGTGEVEERGLGKAMFLKKVLRGTGGDKDP